MSTPSASIAQFNGRAETLRSLHRPGDPVVLANVWDAAGARLVAEAGFSAVATSSSAVAAALGWADGEETPPAEMFAAIRRIARVTDLPVTADVESGYGLEPGDLVARLFQAGAVGCNLEDSDAQTGRLRPVDEQADRLAGVREAAAAAGVGLVLNARIDVFLPGRYEGDRVAEGVARGRRYLAAGADCVYPILAPFADVPRLVDGMGGPVNAIATPDPEEIARLSAAGVARISLGGHLFAAAEAHLRSLLHALKTGY